MAEEYVLIDDIIKNHTERILSLRKFYPFFAITENAFAKFKDGEYKDLDMGYIVLAVIRFFINENSFSDRMVSYPEYEKFVKGLLRRDFGLSQDDEELNRYIFDKLRNYGRAFEMPFYDPESRQPKMARVRIIDSVVKENEILYTITREGIEFYLSTKEIKDESTISMDQLLLEKMIRSENFRGSIDVIERINIEVNALEKRRQEVMQLLLTDVHAGVIAVDEYMDRTTVWFSEEKKSFAKNRELVDKAMKKQGFYGDSGAARDVSRLQTMLKQTIENHSALIAATAELSRFSDEMIRRSRTRSLKNSFDFEGLMKRAFTQDRPDIMQMVVQPFLLPKREKSFASGLIDEVVTGRASGDLRGEKKEELKADLNFRYDDELLSASTSRNYAYMFKELLIRLRRWERVTLEEYLAILEVRFGKDIYINRDLYGFLTHLAGKKYYRIDDIAEDAETFLEEMVAEYLGPDLLDEFRGLEFRIEYGDNIIELKGQDEEKKAELRDMIFIMGASSDIEEGVHNG